MGLPRRIRLLGLLFGLLPVLAGQPRAADGPAPVHGIAMHGDLKYGPGFKHFEYVRPDAPKGGTMRLADEGTFDSFNPFILKGNPAEQAGMVFETLTVGSADEPFSQYGLIAESLEVPEDRSWVIFNLRPEARWHDGKPISADDVVFSLETLRTQGHPIYRQYYSQVVKAEALAERRVKFTFRNGRNRELPLIVGGLPVLPKHFWDGKDFSRTTLEPPLGSGPYRIAAFEPGRYVVLERVKDYWGAGLPVNVGRNNFDVIRADYFRDATVIREALKAGAVDYRLENQAKAWALDYDVAPVRDGWLKKEAVPHQRPTGMQAFVMNSRRDVFKDRRVRQAMAYAFDFEWSNRNLFFGQYVRSESYFSNSDLAATGLPQGGELAILERFRGQVPPEVFTQPYAAPSTDASGFPRDNLRKAFALLDQAGWEVRDMRLVNRTTGEPMRFEIMLVLPEFQRIVLPYVRNLKKLGIDARVRVVDQAQYINRVREFDFDMMVSGWGQSNSPGNEQRAYWTCQAGQSSGSRNYAGICNPAIDALAEEIPLTRDRQDLVDHVKALDRLLLNGHYVVPNWHVRTDRILYWDKFSRPALVPKNGTSIDTWWFDADKARALDARSRVAAAGR